ncbi:MAG: hypothetical protein WCN95_08395 [bacterium]
MDTTTRVAIATIALQLVLAVPSAIAGGPQPCEYPIEYRQANMILLKFQDALTTERWQEALLFCSDRVRKAAQGWPTPKEFFSKTLPLAKVVAGVGCPYWQEQHNGAFHSYGLLIRLTEPRQEPLVQWYWNMFTTNNTWAIDWEPVAIDLNAMIEKQRAEDRDHRKRVETARSELEPKLRTIKTHLTALSDHCVVGSPMLFRVELMNFGKSAINFMAAGVEYHPLRLLNEKSEPIPFVEAPAQIVMREGVVAPESSEILADSIDIAKHYSISRPGTYFVQFDGAPLEIGARIPRTDKRISSEDEFVATSTKLPSNVVKIEVTTGQKE